jgi:hypothetical protein
MRVAKRLHGALLQQEVRAALPGAQARAEVPQAGLLPVP